MPSLLGKPEWLNHKPTDDDFQSDEDMELSPLDDDYIPEEYRSYDD